MLDVVDEAAFLKHVCCREEWIFLASVTDAADKFHQFVAETFTIEFIEVFRIFVDVFITNLE